MTQLNNILKPVSTLALGISLFLAGCANESLEGTIIEKDYTQITSSKAAIEDTVKNIQLTVKTGYGEKKFRITSYGPHGKNKIFEELQDSLYIGRDIKVDLGDESIFKTHFNVAPEQVKYHF